MKRIIVLLILLTALSSYAEKIDFNKSKLDKLTSDLSLTENQQKEMRLIITDESLFMKELISLTPDFNNAAEIMDNRLQRLDLILQRASTILNEKQFAGYIRYKSDSISDATTLYITDKCTLNGTQKIKVYEIVAILKKLGKRSGGMMPPPDDMGGMDGGKLNGGMGGGQRGGDNRKDQINDIIKILDAAVQKIVSYDQFVRYLEVKTYIITLVKKELPVNTDDRGMNGGPGGQGGPQGGGMGGPGGQQGGGMGR